MVALPRLRSCSLLSALGLCLCVLLYLSFPGRQTEPESVGAYRYGGKPREDGATPELSDFSSVAAPASQGALDVTREESKEIEGEDPTSVAGEDEKEAEDAGERQRAAAAEKAEEDRLWRRRRELDKAREIAKAETRRRLDDPAEQRLRQELLVHDDEIAIVVRTGFEVLHRLKGALGTFLTGRENQTFFGSDVESQYMGHTMHDSIARLRKRPKVAQSDRFRYYEDLRDRVGQREDTDVPYDYKNKESKGWELDVLKCFSSIEMAYDHFGPDQKWYIIVDDDTYIHFPSLLPILSKLDFRQEIFMGMGRWVIAGLSYAQGGAGTVISQAAMRSRFIDHADSLGSVHDRAATTRYADHLLAMAMDEIDITVDNTYLSSFHEHEPAKERIGRDELCKPAFTYHHIPVSEMHAIHRDFQGREFRHHDVWSLASDDEQKLWWREEWSYNFELDETDEGDRRDLVEWSLDERHQDQLDAERCKRLCTDASQDCLAWTFFEDEKGRRCYLSDYFRPGGPKVNATGGINGELWKRWEDECTGYP